MSKNKNQERPDQDPPQQSSSQPDPRQDQPKWNDQHPRTPPRDQPGSPARPQERGTKPTGISNRSMEDDSSRQSER